MKLIQISGKYCAPQHVLPGYGYIAHWLMISPVWLHTHKMLTTHNLQRNTAASRLAGIHGPIVVIWYNSDGNPPSHTYLIYKHLIKI